MRPSLFNRIVLPLLPLLLLVTGTGAYALLSYLSAKRTETSLQQSDTNVRLTAHALGEWIGEHRDLTLALADDPSLAALLQAPDDAGRYRRVQERLQHFYDRMGYLENLALFIRLDAGRTLKTPLGDANVADGTIYLDTVSGKTLGKGGYGLDYVRATLHEGATFISAPYPSILRGKPIFVISAPIRSADGKILGALATAPILERFNSKFTRADAASANHTMICDAKGIVISHPDPSKILRESVAPVLAQLPAGSDRGVLMRTEPEGIVWYTYMREPLTGWYVLGKVYRSEIFESFGEERNMLLYSIAALALLLGAGFWWLIGRYALDPLERLRRALMHFSPTSAITAEELGRAASSEFFQINESLLKMSRLFHDHLKVRTTMEEQIRHNAMFDALTELPNRRHLYDHIESLLNAAPTRPFALFFLDLDHFKLINDSLGHDIGDRLLQATARRLASLLDEEDLIARLGGDEFIIVCRSLNRTEAFERLAHELVKAMHEKIVLTNGQMYEFIISTSIGISVYPDHGRDVQTLMKHADIALYAAKEEGRNGYCLFHDGMNEHIRNQMHLEQDMRKALELQQYCLYFQPQVDIESGRVIGAEALIRWQHPEYGLISPVRFIHLAEHTGFIYALGDWILNEACRVLSEWQQHYCDLKLSINISARQFQEPGFLSKVEQALSRHPVNTANLVFEITETLLMTQKEHSREVLERLKEMGIMIAMDDFGTGYSSLAYLKNFPIDIIKIDKAFIQGVLENSGDLNIVKAMISLGIELDLQVIAEGVEELSQVDFLRSSHCTIIQGYFFSTPLYEAAFLEYLRQAGTPS